MLPVGPSAGAKSSPVECDPTTLDADGHGFYCPGRSGAACFGRTGAQLLNSIGHTFTSIEADNNWPRACLYMLAMALFFKLNFAALLVLKTSNGAASHSGKTLDVGGRRVQVGVEGRDEGGSEMGVLEAHQSVRA